MLIWCHGRSVEHVNLTANWLCAGSECHQRLANYGLRDTCFGNSAQPSTLVALPRERCRVSSHLRLPCDDRLYYNRPRQPRPCRVHLNSKGDIRKLGLINGMVHSDALRLDTLQTKQTNKQTPWPESASELYRPPLWSSDQSSWLQI
jgi:hypothetical protein